MLKYLKIFIFFFLLALISCKSIKTIQNPCQENLKEFLGKKVTIQGKSINTKSGAVLMLDDDSFIWINDDEVLSWPDGFYNGENDFKKLEVTGVLIEKYDLPVFIPKKGELIPQGMPVPEGTDLRKASHRFILKKVKWKIISD